MKIGIVSINMYSKGLNFACPLHTYAFQQFLKKNGYDSVVINYKPVYYHGFNLKHPYDYYAKKYNSYVYQKGATEEQQLLIDEKTRETKQKRDAWKPLYERRENRYNKFQDFINKNYVKTKTCYNSDSLEILDPGCDCYICATDVIWKNQPEDGFDRGYFLASSCMENKWKIAYSASRGVYFASNEEEEAEFFHYLEDFDYLSVRENSLKDYIFQNTGREPLVVLDPVLLHEKDFYEEFLVKPPEEHYILLYYVMEKAVDTIEQAVKFARSHHMKIVEITDLPLDKGRLTPYEDIESVFRYDIGIEDWVGYFYYADYVFTNSFHACCLCVLFEKEFFVGHRNGDKVINILETFQLMDRFVTSESDLVSQEPPRIDYEPVREILKNKRQESADFLLSALREIDGKPRPVRVDYEAYKRSLTYRVLYNSMTKKKAVTWTYPDEEVFQTGSHSYEYRPANIRNTNDGTSRFLKNEFQFEDNLFLGWHMRFRVDNFWFRFTHENQIVLDSQYDENTYGPEKLFADEDLIPYLPVNRISMAVAEAVWGSETDILREMWDIINETESVHVQTRKLLRDAQNTLEETRAFLRDSQKVLEENRVLLEDARNALKENRALYIEIDQSLFMRMERCIHKFAHNVRQMFRKLFGKKG